MSLGVNKSGNPILDHAGIVAIFITIMLLTGFVGAVYNVATSHDDGGHAAHGGPPAAGADHH